MKFIPILLTSLSIISSASVLADQHYSADKNLQLINLNLADNKHKHLLDSSCLEQSKYNELNTKKNFSENDLESKRRLSRKRILHAEKTNESLQAKEFNRLNQNDLTPGINVLTIRVSKVKSQLNTKYYANTNRYVNRAALPARMNLQLDSQLDPVYSSIMFTRSGINIPFELSDYKAADFERQLTSPSLSEQQLENLITSINKLHTLDSQDNNSYEALAVNTTNTDNTLCMLTASVF